MCARARASARVLCLRARERGVCVCLNAAAHLPFYAAEADGGDVVGVAVRYSCIDALHQVPSPYIVCMP